jgi:hypothetical protein
MDDDLAVGVAFQVPAKRPQRQLRDFDPIVADRD